jgi:hypothetical protein
MALVDSYPLRIVRRACKACPSCKAHNDCKNPIARLHCTTSQPKLLRANRECYSQLPFFYGANKIISPDTDSLKMLREQHAEVVRYIQRIELLHYVAAQARLIELKNFPRLTHLNIRAEDDYSHHFRPSIPGPTTALRLSQIEQEAMKVLNSPVPRSRHPRFVASKREVRYLMVTKGVKVTFTAEYRAGRYSVRNTRPVLTCILDITNSRHVGPKVVRDGVRDQACQWRQWISVGVGGGSRDLDLGHGGLEDRWLLLRVEVRTSSASLSYFTMALAFLLHSLWN